MANCPSGTAIATLFFTSTMLSRILTNAPGEFTSTGPVMQRNIEKLAAPSCASASNPPLNGTSVVCCNSTFSRLPCRTFIFPSMSKPSMRMLPPFCDPEAAVPAISQSPLKWGRTSSALKLPVFLVGTPETSIPGQSAAMMKRLFSSPISMEKLPVSASS